MFLKDIWMGTQLLFADILISADLLFKQLRGHKASRRERMNLKRTLHDIANLIPITVLMLLPVSTFFTLPPLPQRFVIVDRELMKVLTSYCLINFLLWVRWKSLRLLVENIFKWIKTLYNLCDNYFQKFKNHHLYFWEK